MKKLLSLLMILSLAISAYAQQTFKVDGSEYEITSSNTVRLIKPKNGKDAFVIPESVTYKGQTYRVSNIGMPGFTKSDHKSITIPNTVDSIHILQFIHCKNLESLTVPDFAILYEGADFADGYKKYGLHGFFEYSDYAEKRAILQCQNLSSISTPTGNVPYYLLAHIDKAINYPDDKIYSTFSYYAYEQLTPRLYEWAKKKSIESPDQWRARVTEKNRDAKLLEWIEEIKPAYIKKYGPVRPEFYLGNYDSDYQVFDLSYKGKLIGYVEVPKDEMQFVKDNWTSAKINPVYGIVNDTVGLSSVTVEIMGHHYFTPKLIVHVPQQTLEKTPALKIPVYILLQAARSN